MGIDPMLDGDLVDQPSMGGFSQDIAEESLAKDLAAKLRTAWLREDRTTGRIDHFWAADLDGSLTLVVIGRAFDLFTNEFPGVFPELDRVNRGPDRVTRVCFRRDFRL